MQFGSLAKSASLVAMGLLLAGHARAAETVTLAVQGTPNNKAAFDKVVAAFEAQSDISVRVDYIGGNYGAVITTQLQGSNAPDIVQLVPGGSVPHSVLNVAESGRLADLSDALWVDQIAPDTLPLVSADSAVYAWPASVQVSGLIVNQNILRDNGLDVPTVMDDLLALCGALREKGIVPIGWSGSPQTRNGGQATTVAGATGAAVTSVNEPINRGEAKFSDSPEWHAVVDTIATLREANCFDPDSATMNDRQASALMLRGDAAMMMSNSLQLGVLLRADAGKTLDLQVFAFPGETEADSHVLVAPYDALAITASSEVKDAAKAFIAFLTQPDIQRDLAEGLGNIAPVDVRESTLPDVLAPLRPYFASEKVQINPVMFWRGGRLYLSLSAGVQGLLTGQLKPDDVLADMDRVNLER